MEYNVWCSSTLDITRNLAIYLVIRIELFVRRSNRKDFLSKECITFESLEKNNFFMKS